MEWPTVGLVLSLLLHSYCPCPLCCGKYAGGNTTSGWPPVAGLTVASRQLPIGTGILIDGTIYIVQDYGGPSKELGADVFVRTHGEALAHGARRRRATILFLPGREGRGITKPLEDATPRWPAPFPPLLALH